MNAELKQKIKDSMMQLLTAQGYPNISNDQILQLLPNLWQKLAAEGLLVEPIKEGLTYQHFINIALHKKQQIDTMEEVAAFVRNRNGV